MMMNAMNNTRPSMIGYETNSRDPERQKARVFVGGLSHQVSRDDVIELFASYGQITGATLFKGYAFVQYSNAAESDLATMALNGYVWQKAKLEVKVAYDPTKQKSTEMPGKRTKRENGGPTEKRTKYDNNNTNAVVSSPAAVAPTTTTTAVKSNAPVQSGPELNCDMFLCGGCRFYTSSFEAFVNHRYESCTGRPRKVDGELENFRCFTCANTFMTSWELLFHLRTSHEITMYKIDKE